MLRKFPAIVLALSLALIGIGPLSAQSRHSGRLRATPHHYYTNQNREPSSRKHSTSVPSGATAECRDGSYSFSEHRSGTCSHHGGVAKWIPQ